MYSKWLAKKVNRGIEKAIIPWTTHARQKTRLSQSSRVEFVCWDSADIVMKIAEMIDKEADLAIEDTQLYIRWRFCEMETVGWVVKAAV